MDSEITEQLQAVTDSDNVRVAEVGMVSGPIRRALERQIIFLVCEELDISALELLCPNRHRPLPMARQLVAWLLWTWEGFTQQQAADVLGVTVSTVGYYIRNVERRRRNHGEWAPTCKRLVKALIDG